MTDLPTTQTETTCCKTKVAGYACPLKILHWVIGLTIIALLGVGLYMSDLPPDAFKWQLYGLHKGIGILVLAAVLIRLSVRISTQTPAPLPTHQQWEKGLAKVTHVFLYLAMFGMPLSGWAMSSAGGHPVSVFGIGIPPLLPENKELGGLFNQIHELLGYALIVAIGLHVAGALKHAIIDRDDTLKRMLPSCGKCCGGECACKTKPAETPKAEKQGCCGGCH